MHKDDVSADDGDDRDDAVLTAADVADGPIPTHVACVMDGNGRWAARRGLPRTEGHAAGEAALLDAVDGALELGIPWITMYAFSTENWRRPPDEVRYLMGFNESLLMRRRDELNEKGVRIRFAGRRDWRVPKRVLKRMDESIELTKDNRRCTLTMAFNYGGRAEIVDAVRDLVAEGEELLEGFLDLLLHPHPAGLHLPTGIVCAIVGDDELEFEHRGRARQAGGALSR